MYICTTGCTKTFYFHLIVCHQQLSKSIPIDLTQKKKKKEKKNSNKPKSKLIVLCYVSARKIYLTGSFLCLVNILLLSNADINILIIHVVAQMFPHAPFLSSGFAW